MVSELRLLICSVTERRRWRPPYQMGKTVHVHAKKHYKHNENGCTAPCVLCHGVLCHAEPPGGGGGTLVREFDSTHTQQYTCIRITVKPTPIRTPFTYR